MRVGKASFRNALFALLQGLMLLSALALACSLTPKQKTIETKAVSASTSVLTPPSQSFTTATATISTPTTQPTITPIPTGKVGLRILEEPELGFRLSVPVYWYSIRNEYVLKIVAFGEDLLLQIIANPGRDLNIDLSQVLAIGGRILESYEPVEFGPVYPSNFGKNKVLWREFTFQSESGSNGILMVISREMPQYVIVSVWKDNIRGPLTEAEKEQFFEVVETIELFAPSEATDVSGTPVAYCVLSPNPDYGRNAENAIQIGGGDKDGEARVRQYLENLRAEGGAEITFARAGKDDFDPGHLRIFNVRTPNGLVSLYFAIAKMDEVYLPPGFECKGEFNFGD